MQTLNVLYRLGLTEKGRICQDQSTIDQQGLHLNFQNLKSGKYQVMDQMQNLLHHSRTFLLFYLTCSTSTA